MDGRPIADTNLGKAWAEQIESYADTPLRIAKGRQLFRKGAVNEMKVSFCKCLAVVSESENVTITMDLLSEGDRERLSSSIGKTLFENSEVGADERKEMFPSKEHIRYECTCGDKAGLCKHSIAVLYALGADGSKGLLTMFGLSESYISNRLIQDSIDVMLSNADNHSDRIIPYDEVKRLFGV